MATARKTVAKSAVTKPAAAAPAAKPAVKKLAVKKAPAKPAAPVPKPAVPEAPKPVKLKLVRDGFTIPAGEYAVLGDLKQRALAAGHPAKKANCCGPVSSCWRR